MGFVDPLRMLLAWRSAPPPPRVNVDAIPAVDIDEDAWVFDTGGLDLSDEYDPTWT